MYEEMNKKLCFYRLLYDNSIVKMSSKCLQQSKQKALVETLTSLMGEHQQSILIQTVELFFIEAMQGSQDVNSSHMFSRNTEVTVFVEEFLYVYRHCFNVYHKFLLKGHKIVLKHHNSGCNNMLIVEKTV